MAKFVGKGSQVGVTGRIQVKSFQDNEGNNRNSVEVKADNVQFLS